MLIGSLFSGIGGLELGLEMSGVGRTIWQVECDEFCRRVLDRHWPDVERFEDVKKVGSHNLQTVDLICGGFPCQDISSAGKGAGLAGSRSGLWFEFARILEELRPSWVVVENVSSGAKRWVDQITFSLEQLDYETLPVPLSAEDVGAPHLRRRVFIIAYTERSNIREQCWRCSRPQGQDSGKSRDDGTQWAVTDADGPRFPRSERTWPTGRQVSTDSTWSTDTMPEPSLCRVDDGPAAWVDRNKRLKALGNAVVPQCAEVIGHVILELERRSRGPL